MRLATLSAFLLIGIAALPACRGGARLAPPPGAQIVKLKVKCRDNKLEVDVKPFAVRIYANESVFWEPDKNIFGGGGNDVTVTIVPKANTPWPFAAAPPTVPPTSGADSGPLRTATADTVGYDLRFSCIIDGVTRSITIDPDIIISGGTRIQ